MNISNEHIAAVQALGYTPEEARFLYIVATHSGYFVPRQFILFAGTSAKRSDHFTTKLESRGHATWREYLHVGGVYHLFSRTLYRVIDKQTLRNRRRHSTDYIRTRLVLLDFVLANQGYRYLETEHDKVSYFCDTLGIPKTDLPARPYVGSSRLEPALRYFVDRFPLFLDAPGDSAPITFCYVDSGETRLAGLVRHLNAYEQLFSRLPDFRFLYVSNFPAHFAPAERCFAAFARRAFGDTPPKELIRYFTLRARWDQKQYEGLSHDDIEWLDRANRRFRALATEHLYTAWCAGELSSDRLTSHLADASPYKIRFSPFLITPGQMTTEKLAKPG